MKADMHLTTLDQQAIEQARFDKDYEFYKKQFAQAQAESDAFDDWMGVPRTDIAWTKAMERAQRRAYMASGAHTWDAQVARFREHLDRKAYAQAIGVDADA